MYPARRVRLGLGAIRGLAFLSDSRAISDGITKAGERSHAGAPPDFRP